MRHRTNKWTKDGEEQIANKHRMRQRCTKTNAPDMRGLQRLMREALNIGKETAKGVRITVTKRWGRETTERDRQNGMR